MITYFFKILLGLLRLGQIFLCLLQSDYTEASSLVNIPFLSLDKLFKAINLQSLPSAMISGRWLFKL